MRRKYEEVGVGMEVPPELPRPLRVGQEVTARHPLTRQLHDGVILTVKGNKYRCAALTTLPPLLCLLGAWRRPGWASFLSPRTVGDDS